MSWHDLGVSAGDLDASVEASSVVSVSDDSAEAVVGANRAIVRALRSGVTIVGPSKRPGRELSLSSDKGVFLFDTEPWLISLCSIENFLGVNSEVGVGGGELLAGAISPLVGLGHDDDMVSTSEGISVVGDGLHDNLGVVSVSLVAGGTIVVPVGEVSEGADATFNGSALGAESDTTSVNPDVLSDGAVGDFFPAAGVVDVLVVEGKMFVIGHFLMEI